MGELKVFKHRFLGSKHHPRGKKYIFTKSKMPLLLQHTQSGKNKLCFKLKVLCKCADVKVIKHPLARAYRDIQIIRQCLIYFLYLIKRRETHIGHRLQLHYFIVIIQQYGIRFLAIPACSPCFLIITFQTVRHVKVHHRAHIRLINSHPKRIGTNNYTNLVTNPALLFTITFLLRKPCMIIICRNVLKL